MRNYINAFIIFFWVLFCLGSYANKTYDENTVIVYNSVVHLWLDLELALHVVGECNWSWDRQHCYKFTVWIMKAESSLCQKASSKNNCFGIMHRPDRNWNKRTVKGYDSHKESITDFVRRYKKYRQYRQDTSYWVLPKWNYCTDHCQDREWNVQYAINIMNKPLDINK